jgi:hypothetical protein
LLQDVPSHDSEPRDNERRDPAQEQWPMAWRHDPRVYLRPGVRPARFTLSTP